MSFVDNKTIEFTTEQTGEAAFDAALLDATEAFFRVMNLHGFTRRDDLDEFQQQMARSCVYSFYRMSGGPHPDAASLVKAMLDTH